MANVSKLNGLAVLLALAPLHLAAQNANSDQSGSFRDWSYFVVSDPKECVALSAPTAWTATKDGEVVAAERGDIRFYISFYPGETSVGVPSFGAGYPLSTAGQVEVTIGGSAFVFLPDADIDRAYAWSQPNDDAGVIAAMKAGAQATVVGHSARGKTTTDTFSLIGFTAAYEKARELCR